ncbi:AsmA-like C-terminal region-containing protein [Thiotrichales bacterium 19S9-12]|nr:AsmA-like C-terminal region-containing protein [Thiotrichales bacterium 19S9-11]MCF6811718.1 AsmA-like C-terminal region-containing protein [Thiotrichales bacterium 19S9-12]
MKFSPLNNIIAKEVSQVIGKEVSFKGVYVSYSFTDGVSINVDDLSLSNKVLEKDSDNLPILNIHHAMISFNVSSLFEEFKLNQVVVNQAIVNYDANSPWFEDKQVEKQKTLESQKIKQATSEKVSYESQVDSFDWLRFIPAIIVTKSQINYINQNNKHYKVDIISQEINDDIGIKEGFSRKIMGEVVINGIQVDNHGVIKSNNLSQNFDVKMLLQDHMHNKISLMGQFVVDKDNGLSITLNTAASLIELNQWHKVLPLELKQIQPLTKLNLEGNFEYKSSRLFKADLDLNAVYNAMNYILEANAQSQKDTILFPLSFIFKVHDDKNNLAINAGGVINEPFSPKWLDIKLDIKAKDLAVFDQNNSFPVNNLNLNAKVNGDNNRIILNKANLKLSYKEKPLFFILDYQLTKDNLSYPMNFNLSGRYNNQPILKAKANIKPVLNEGAYILDYDITLASEYVNKKVTEKVAKPDHLQLKGMMKNPKSDTNWFDLSILGYIDQLSHYAPLLKMNLPELEHVDFELNISSSKDKLNFYINKAIANYLEDTIKLKGHGSYDILNDDKLIQGGLFLSNNKDYADFTFKGFWNDEQGIKSDLLIHLNELKTYQQLFSWSLIDMKDVNLKTTQSLYPSRIVIDDFNYLSGTEGTMIDLALQGDYHFLSQDFNLAVNQLNFNGLALKSHMTGKLEDDTFYYQGDIDINSADLKGANQLLYEWFDIYLPELQNVKLIGSYHGENKNVKSNLTVSSSAFDLKGDARLSSKQNKYHLSAKIDSQLIDLFKIYTANENAKKSLKIQQDESNKNNAKKEQQIEDISKAAQAESKERKEIPEWMKVGIYNLVNQYQSQINVDIKTLILSPNDIVKNVNLDIKTDPKDSYLKLNAESVLSGSVNIDANLRPLATPVGAYQLQIGGYLGVLELDQKTTELFKKLPIEKGQFMAQIESDSQGVNTYDLISDLKGKLKLAAQSVVIKLFENNTTSVFGRFLLLLSGDSWSKSVNITCAYGHMEIDKGIVNLKDSLINSKGAVVTATGDINLMNQSVDIVLTPKAKFVNLATFAVPFVLQGSFDKLYFYPDTQGTLVKTGTTAALLATGVGAVAWAATEATTGTYRAAKDYCKGVMDKF